ncbi:MAG: hypothetical protein Tp1111DCM1126091_83 [Prokaryotic dsDNA virus sp.]|nr:MAG: hypothetical protein Tp1111DCM1126091_83 [Prokaryotic dsDNA virus sp.]|tara:strand:- start:62752 stop:63015 length:264 start_codon:yes stop_codon:yes gene_type:complete
MSNRKTPEEILQINGFEKHLNHRWFFKNDFGIIRVDLDKEEIAFRKPTDPSQDFYQMYDQETFDAALVQTYVRSGMYDYLRQKQEST